LEVFIVDKKFLLYARYHSSIQASLLPNIEKAVNVAIVNVFTNRHDWSEFSGRSYNKKAAILLIFFFAST